MPSSFPGALDNVASNKSESTVTANDHAPHHNALADAINAVQTALGVNLGNVALVGAPASAAASAVSAHEAAVDPHTQYTTASEAAAAAPVQSVAGRTGAVTLAKADVGLGNVDNTSDANKPVSTAAQAALDGKAATTHTHVKADITNFSDADYATAAQGALAATAVQPAAIANFETTTQLNARDTANRNRTNHTGTQTASTISDFATAAATAAPVQSVAGRTGAVTLAKADVGLSNVDNTSDANKPVSTATQTALDAKVGSVTTGITGADQITNMVSLTQAEFDAIGTKSATTFYVIAG
jgi:hypothetical protein